MPNFEKASGDGAGVHYAEHGQPRAAFWATYGRVTALSALKTRPNTFIARKKEEAASGRRLCCGSCHQRPVECPRGCYHRCRNSKGEKEKHRGSIRLRAAMIEPPQRQLRRIVNQRSNRPLCRFWQSRGLNRSAQCEQFYTDAGK
jgi:hypothetical protein